MNFQSRRLRVSFAPEVTDDCMGSLCCQGTEVCPIPSNGCQYNSPGEGPDYCAPGTCFYGTGCIESVTVALPTYAAMRMGAAELAALHRELRGRVAVEEEGAE